MNYHRLLGRLLVAVAAAPLLPGAPLHAQSIPPRGAVERDTALERAALEMIRVPEGFEVDLFAGPPAAMYPTCLDSAPDGALFVCVDPNLSLSAGKGIGRVVRLVDDDGDGRADHYTVFAEMDSPRGLVADGETVYVMHPPTLTAYRDTDGDGVADESRELVRGLGFDLDFRGADHTTNGVTQGIDGWLYVAVGDYGVPGAVGADGRRLHHRGGAVVRVRPDGTGLEIYAEGTRNIYDVAVSPMLHVFARDNTNDGDGWDTRLHYLPPGADMGYPNRYRNFGDEIMPSLVDYGAGAGTGGLWVQDGGLPEEYNTLYTGDWALSSIFRHPLEPEGASFEAEQERFLTVPLPADLAMDGRSNMYVASLAGGSFFYAGDSVGYVIQVRYPGRPADEFPQLDALSDAELLRVLTGYNSVQRLQAQREILRRSRNPSTARELERLTLDASQPGYARVAAMFTLKQMLGEDSHEVLRRAAADPAIRALALRALADRATELQGVPVELFVEALADPDPRVRLQAVNGLVRLGASVAGDEILPLTASSDSALAHLAVQGLVELGAEQPALQALDSGTPAVQTGALRVLQQLHDPAVVDALIERYQAAQDPVLRHGILLALARLAHQEEPWEGDEWWGTKPAFAGPYFAPTVWEQTERIRPVLREALLAARGQEYETLVGEFVRNRVLPTGAQPLLLAVGDPSDPRRPEVVGALVGSHQLPVAAAPLLTRLDAESPDMRHAVAQLLAGEPTFEPAALTLVHRAALDEALDPALRSRLLQAVARMPGEEGTRAAVELFARLIPTPDTDEQLEQVWRRYVDDRERLEHLDALIDIARTGAPAERTLAFAMLAPATQGDRATEEVQRRVASVIEAAWSDPAAAPSLVQAIELMDLEEQYADRLRADPVGVQK